MTYASGDDPFAILQVLGIANAGQTRRGRVGQPKALVDDARQERQLLEPVVGEGEAVDVLGVDELLAQLGDHVGALEEAGRDADEHAGRRLGAGHDDAAGLGEQAEERLLLGRQRRLQNRLDHVDGLPGRRLVLVHRSVNAAGHHLGHDKSKHHAGYEYDQAISYLLHPLYAAERRVHLDRETLRNAVQEGNEETKAMTTPHACSHDSPNSLVELVVKGGLVEMAKGLAEAEARGNIGGEAAEGVREAHGVAIGGPQSVAELVDLALGLRLEVLDIGRRKVGVERCPPLLVQRVRFRRVGAWEHAKEAQVVPLWLGGLGRVLVHAVPLGIIDVNFPWVNPYDGAWQASVLVPGRRTSAQRYSTKPEREYSVHVPYLRCISSISTQYLPPPSLKTS